jgi:protein TonB
MNTTVNSSMGAPYLLNSPIAKSSPKTVPVLIAVAVHVALILGLAKGLSEVRLPSMQTITEAFSVPETVEPKKPEPEPDVALPQDASMTPVPMEMPVIPIEPDVPVTVETPNAISSDPQPSQPVMDTPFAQVQLLRRVEPQYPAMSKRMDEQGTVVMRLTIMPNGRVSKVDVLNSSGFARLDQAAKDAVRQWTFARRDGAAVAYTVTVPVKFQLDEMR